MPDRLEIGRITKPHGLGGDVLVKFITDRLDERTAPGAELVTRSDRILTVERASPHKDRWIVHFAGVDTREQAESLHGHLLFADPLEDTGDVFVHDLIGRRLLTPDGHRSRRHRLGGGQPGVGPDGTGRRSIGAIDVLRCRTTIPP